MGAQTNPPGAPCAPPLGDPARISMLLEGASFPAALWSGSQLRFTWTNRIFRDLLEDVRPQWDLLGMPVRGFLSDSRSASRFIDVAYTGQPVTVPAYEFKASWGDVSYWQLSYLPVPGRIGHPFDVLLLAVDVTAHVVEQEERDLAAAEMRRALNLIDVTVLSSLDAEEIVQRVLVEATEALGADWGWLAEREEGVWVFRNVHGWPIEISGLTFSDDELSLPALAARSGHAMAVSISEASTREDFELMAKHDIGGFALVPLKNRGDVCGVMGFCWDADLTFGAEHRELLQKLELSLSLALENARQYASERQVTRKLRSAFFSTPHALPGYELGHLYHSASGAATVGGDFYDVMSLGDDRIGLVIGDVAGRGLEAAGLTSLVKTAIRSEALRVPSPQSVMSRANELVMHGAEPHEFVSAFFGLVDSPSGRVAYSLAGHPPPVVVRADGEAAFLPEDGGVLGVTAGMSYGNREMLLDVGDLLVLYTDGLTDARTPRGEEYGRERLLRACVSAAGQSAVEVPEALFLSAFSFSEGHLADDVAIVALRRTEALSGSEQGSLEFEAAIA
ncbi:MAG: SpoIIE family protein phosphatase [Coriobacteriia bacterium]